MATAASAAEALALAREQPPQLLVIDLHLPDTDGPALLQRLAPRAGARRRAGLPVQRRRRRGGARSCAAQAGFAGCWSKPLDVGALRRELAALGLAAAGA